MCRLPATDDVGLPARQGVQVGRGVPNYHSQLNKNQKISHGCSILGAMNIQLVQIFPLDSLPLRPNIQILLYAAR